MSTSTKYCNTKILIQILKGVVQTNNINQQIPIPIKVPTIRWIMRSQTCCFEMPCKIAKQEIGIQYGFCISKICPKIKEMEIHIPITIESIKETNFLFLTWVVNVYIFSDFLFHSNEWHNAIKQANIVPRNRKPILLGINSTV